MIQEDARVLWNRHVRASYYRIGLISAGIYAEAEPGQFVMLRLSDGADPLLRRPLSIHRPILAESGEKGIELLYAVVGKGTERLSTYREGDALNTLGPLGNGFTLPDDPGGVMILAGGIGVAPMLFLASSLAQMRVRPNLCWVFLGARSKQDLLCLDEFSGLGLEVSVSTDDGTAGHAGPVTVPFETALGEARPDMIYACGPPAMLKRVAKIAQAHAVPCQVSLETIMACGIGACLGCAVETREESAGYLHACKDGPVFDAHRVKI